MEHLTVTEGVEHLLERVRSRRTLPRPDERRAIRDDAGLSLREVAAAIGVSRMAVVRWESGAKPRNPEHVAAYGRLLEELRRLTPTKGGHD